MRRFGTIQSVVMSQSSVIVLKTSMNSPLKNETRKRSACARFLYSSHPPEAPTTTNTPPMVPPKIICVLLASSVQAPASCP